MLVVNDFNNHKYKMKCLYSYDTIFISVFIYIFLYFFNCFL